MRLPLSPPAIICLVTVLFLAPFANKAFHIDDPLFVWAAQQIQKHPLDPYGFTVNWNDKPELMWQVTKNPPLDCYYIAAVALVTGFGEFPLHLAFLLPACLMTAGTYVLAKRYVQRPLWAAFLALITPAFWVSATSVMCDVWMVALSVWAVIWWIKAVEQDSLKAYVISGVLLALSALFKYFAVSLLAVFLVHGIQRKANPAKAVLAFLVPVGALAGYEAWTHSLYGYGMIREAMRWSARSRGVFFTGRTMQSLITLMYYGGCLLPLGWLAVCSSKLRGVALFALGAVVLFGVTAGINSRDPKFTYHAHLEPPSVWVHAVVFLFLCVASLCGAALVFRSVSGREGANVVLLGLWALLTLVFVGGFNWVVNARVLLPLVPPMAILAQIAFERAGGAAWSQKRFALVMVPAVLLGLMVNIGDYQLAEAGRSMPDELARKRNIPMNRVAFSTHWGFQYYMERAGATAADATRLGFPSGFVFVQPTQGSSGFHLDPSADLELVEKIQPAALPIASTCGPFEYFYATFGRVLPFRFGVKHGQEFEVLVVR